MRARGRPHGAAPTAENVRERWFGKARRECGTPPFEIFHKAGPLWARRELQRITQILRAGKDAQALRSAASVTGDRGKGEYGRISAHPEPSPGDSLVTFSSLRKSLAAGAAKSPPHSLKGNEKRRRGQAPALQRWKHSKLGISFQGGRPHGAAPTEETKLGALARQSQAQKMNRNGGNFCKLRAQWPGMKR